MFDQVHSTKPKIEAMIQSVNTAQYILAQSLLVNRNKLIEYQEKFDLVGAEEYLFKAFRRDVTPLIWKFRKDLNLPEDPLEYYKRSDYHSKIIKNRG